MKQILSFPSRIFILLATLILCTAFQTHAAAQDCPWGFVPKINEVTNLVECVVGYAPPQTTESNIAQSNTPKNNENTPDKTNENTKLNTTGEPILKENKPLPNPVQNDTKQTKHKITKKNTPKIQEKTQITEIPAPLPQITEPPQPINNTRSYEEIPSPTRTREDTIPTDFDPEPQNFYHQTDEVYPEVNEDYSQNSANIQNNYKNSSQFQYEIPPEIDTHPHHDTHWIPANTSHESIDATAWDDSAIPISDENQPQNQPSTMIPGPHVGYLALVLSPVVGFSGLGLEFYMGYRFWEHLGIYTTIHYSMFEEYRHDDIVSWLITPTYLANIGAFQYSLGCGLGFHYEGRDSLLSNGTHDDYSFAVRPEMRFDFYLNSNFILGFGFAWAVAIGTHTSMDAVLLLNIGYQFDLNHLIQR